MLSVSARQSFTWNRTRHTIRSQGGFPQNSVELLSSTTINGISAILATRPGTSPFRPVSDVLLPPPWMCLSQCRPRCHSSSSRRQNHLKNKAIPDHTGKASTHPYTRRARNKAAESVATELHPRCPLAKPLADNHDVDNESELSAA